jgi:hypothetical protein
VRAVDRKPQTNRLMPLTRHLSPNTTSFISAGLRQDHIHVSEFNEYIFEKQNASSERPNLTRNVRDSRALS